MKSSFLKHLPLLLAAGIFVASPATLLADTLKERQEKVTTVVKTSGKAVVGVGGIGSGVVITKDGVILTAAHVLDAFRDMPMMQEKGQEGIIPITLADGRRVKAKMLGSNRNRDAAMAKIITEGEYAFAEMADPASLKQGAWCLAMGHPGGYQADRTPPVRLGRLWEKADDKYHRTDCTVSGGDSGGPLFDLSGKVIGIHSSIGMRLEENRHVPIPAFKESWERLEKGDAWGNLGKLMPELAPFDRPHSKDKDKAEEKAKPKSNEMKKDEKPEAKEAEIESRPSLGVALNPDAKGAEIMEVADGSAADKAGFKVGDSVKKINGSDVKDADAFIEVISGKKPGDKVKFSISRDGKDMEIEATLGKK